MASDHPVEQLPEHTAQSGPTEPQLKYSGLEGDVPILLQNDRVSCLCLSDKILALGTDKGRVHVLDYSGNEVRRLELHKGRVTELAFDAAEEHLASGSDDASLAVSSLYSDTVLRYETRKPVVALALDPRYSSRKSKEVVWAAPTGPVLLCSAGWLGRSDSPLPAGMGGDVQVIRWWGSLVAWATPRALMVYCMTQHQLIRTIPRAAASAPAPGPVDPDAAAARASLLFGQNGYLYASWADCIKVARTFSVENSVGAVGAQLEVIAELRLPHTVLGASPFGRDLAVLTASRQGLAAATTAQPAPATPPAPPATGAAEPESQQEGWPQHTPDNTAGAAGGDEGDNGQAEMGGDTAAAPTSTAAAAVASGEGAGEAAALTAGNVQPDAPPRPFVLTLRIVTLRGVEAAADVLPLTLPPLPPGPPPPGYHHPVSLVPSLPATTSDATQRHLKRDWNALLQRALHYQTYAWSTQYSSAGGSSATAATAAAKSDKAGDGDSGGVRSGRPTATGSSAGHSPAGSVPQTPRGGRVGGVGGERPGSSAASVAASDMDAHPDHMHGAGAEFMYFVAGPQAVLVGRTRDADDRCAWFLQVGRFADALALAEEELPAYGGAPPRRIVAQKTYDTVVDAVMNDVLGRGAYVEAAAMSRRLLRGNAAKWEQLVYAFDPRQLPKLAPHVPTDAPRLRSSVYDLLLRALLASPPDHPTLLHLVRTWPPGLYSMPALTDAVVGRVKRAPPAAAVPAASAAAAGGAAGQQAAAGETRELWLLLSHLYERQGRPDLSLSILLQLRDPGVFGFLETCGAEGRVLPGLRGRGAAQLVAIDEGSALRVLTRAMDVLAPGDVVPGLQEAAAEAGPPGSEGHERWRRVLWRYLATVTAADPNASADYHELQLRLAADYAPGSVMELLVASSSVPLEAALAVCEERGLVAEQVYILGRMGAASRALHLIIHQLGDIPQAIDFVRTSRDEELWEPLITWALSKPDTTGALLDHIGGHINPLDLVRRIPKGTEIPRLRDRLRAIIADFRTQTSLREGCNVILRSDCAHLIARLYRGARAALPSVYVAPHALRTVLPQRAHGAGGRGSQGHPTPLPVSAAAQGTWARYDASCCTATSVAQAELPYALHPVAEQQAVVTREGGPDPLAPPQPILLVCMDGTGSDAAVIPAPAHTRHQAAASAAGPYSELSGVPHAASPLPLPGTANLRHPSQRHQRQPLNPHSPSRSPPPPSLPSLLVPTYARSVH